MDAAGGRWSSALSGQPAAPVAYTRPKGKGKGRKKGKGKGAGGVSGKNTKGKGKGKSPQERLAGYADKGTKPEKKFCWKYIKGECKKGGLSRESLPRRERIPAKEMGRQSTQKKRQTFGSSSGKRGRESEKVVKGRNG